VAKIKDTKENGNPDTRDTREFQDIYEGKIPPYSKELEMNVIGGMIIDNSLIDTVTTILKPKHFYDTRHSLIIKAIMEMRDRNEPIDLLTLTEELKSRAELEKVGGPLFLSEIATSYSSLESILFSAKKILEYWVKRDLIKLTYEIREMCLDPTSHTENLLDKAQHEILDVTNYLEKKSYSHVRDEVKSTMEFFESIHEKGDEIVGVPSGYSELDALTGGFQKSELIVVAGRPSHGKTALALNIARNAAIGYGKNIGIFSIEMSNRELALRFLCLEAKVDILKLKTGKLPQSEWDKIANTSPIFYDPKTNIIIDDTSPLGLLELRAKSRRMKSEFNIDMVMVDYLQLMEVGNLRKTDNRYLEIGYITRGLKELAKELDIPVVALSQLSRKVEDRAGKEKKPQLSDLRESGSIEQDADVVIFINRPELYMSKAEREREDEVTEAVGRNRLQGLAEVIVGKQRNGPIGQVDLTFIKSYAKFELRAKEVEPMYYTSRNEPF
jgi:replicative DNA helicase